MGNSEEKQEKGIVTKTGKRVKIAIEYIDISYLTFADYNPRRLTDEQHEQLKRSIEDNGFVDPVIVNNHPDRKNIIIGGHMRVRIAKELGYDEVPCVFINMPFEQERIFNVRLNKNTGEWDFDMLANHYDYDELLDIGFSEGELAGFGDMNVSFDEEDDEKSPEAPEIPKTVKGDIYDLGGHRLMCGDSTDISNVQALYNGVTPIIMVTDPPYGVEYDPEWREGKNLGVVRAKGKVQNDDRADWTDAYALFEGDVAYVYHSGKYSHIVAQNLIDCNFEINAQIIWAKQHFALSRGDYHWQHEACWYAIREGKKHNWQGKRDQSTLWEIKNNNAFGNSDKEETWGHGTQKPLECMMRPIMNNTRKGQTVYDPFGGSGTTLISCEKLGRNCLTMELDERYCDVIVKRYVDYCKRNKNDYEVIRNGEPCNEFV